MSGAVQSVAEAVSGANVPFDAFFMAVTRYDTLSVATTLWSVQMHRRIGDCVDAMPVGCAGPAPGLGGMRLTNTVTCWVWPSGGSHGQPARAAGHLYGCQAISTSSALA